MRYLSRLQNSTYLAIRTSSCLLALVLSFAISVDYRHTLAQDLSISKETTRITKPLTDDGYVDYVEAFNKNLSKGLTPSNNAAVAYWQAVGADDPLFGRGKLFHQRFFDQLGIEKPPSEGKYFVRLWKIAEQDARDACGCRDAVRPLLQAAHSGHVAFVEG